MKPTILNEVFAAFCESRTHFDSMVSKLDPSKKSKVATLLGAFLRRPLTIAGTFKIQLEASPEEFWALSFIRLKKHAGIHATLRDLWERWEEIPSEGSVVDFPPSLVAEWTRDWGEDHARKMARLLSQDPLTVIRFHRRSFGKDGRLLPDLETWLSSSALPKSRQGHHSERARVFRGFASVQKNEWFKNGYFEIQDEGSQIMSLYALLPETILPLLGDRPRVERGVAPPIPKDVQAPALEVVDACAGAGGKTLALSDLMGGKGRVFAYDVFETKIRNLKQRVDRAGERNVQARLLPRNGDNGLTSFEGKSDVVLIDAPCSGTGVLRRNPDTKWNRKPLEQAKAEGSLPIAMLQDSVLEQYSRLVKPGGRLVYGVCTQNRAESTGRIEHFLETHPRFSLDSSGFMGPFDTDGFYMASLRAGE
jgi:16S rRNA C967 or C1407 C5-methylase (RsmB/RsmF family)